MKIYDVGGFGIGDSSVTDVHNINSDNTFKPNEFGKEIVNKTDPLVRYEAINKKFNLGKLLMGMGLDIHRNVMYCPFHNDEMTGKPSAKYHHDSDILYCFSENKSYTAYHALKILYGKDMNEVFDMVWSSFSTEDKREVLDKFSSDGVVVDESESEIVFKKYDKVLSIFSRGGVSYDKHKNALYKVLLEISKAKEGTNNENYRSN